MVTTHQISAELYNDSFLLIGIRCDLKGYSLAYHINRTAGLKLKCAEHCVSINHVDFELFEWNDETNGNYYALCGNTAKRNDEEINENLFSKEATERTYYFIQERKEIDYFLKIETEDDGLLPFLTGAINAIEQVVTAHEMDKEALKSKRNLIF